MLQLLPLLLAEQPTVSVQPHSASITTTAATTEQKAQTPSSTSVSAVAIPETTPQTKGVVVEAYPVPQSLTVTPSPTAQISSAVEAESSPATVASPKPVPNEVAEAAQPIREIVVNAETEPSSVAPAPISKNQAAPTPQVSESPAAKPTATPAAKPSPAIALPTPAVTSPSSPSLESKQPESKPSEVVVPTQQDTKTAKSSAIAKQQETLSQRLAEIVARDRAFKEAQQRETLITRAYEYANQGRFAQARRLLQNPVIPNEARTEVISTISSLEQENTNKPAVRPAATLKERRFEQTQIKPRFVPTTKPLFVTQVPRAVAASQGASLPTLPQLPNSAPRPIPVRAEAAPQRVDLNTPVASDSDYSTVNPTGGNLQAYNRNLPTSGQPQGDELMYPLPNPVPVTSGYGWRVHPVTKARRFHAGVDLGAAQGTPVIASRGGRVSIADRLGGYGLAIVLEHKDGTQDTLYAHLSEMFVRPGQEVRPGTVIGRSGSTGLSTGPHLHYEARVQKNASWVTVDPGPQLESARERLAQALRSQRSPS